jgi:hypothetical protein
LSWGSSSNSASDGTMTSGSSALRRRLKSDIETTLSLGPNVMHPRSPAAGIASLEPGAEGRHIINS